MAKIPEDILLLVVQFVPLTFKRHELLPLLYTSKWFYAQFLPKLYNQVKIDDMDTLLKLFRCKIVTEVPAGEKEWSSNKVHNIISVAQCRVNGLRDGLHEIITLQFSDSFCSTSGENLGGHSLSWSFNPTIHYTDHYVTNKHGIYYPPKRLPQLPPSLRFSNLTPNLFRLEVDRLPSAALGFPAYHILDHLLLGYIPCIQDISFASHKHVAPSLSGFLRYSTAIQLDRDDDLIDLVVQECPEEVRNTWRTGIPFDSTLCNWNVREIRLAERLRIWLTPMYGSNVSWDEFPIPEDYDWFENILLWYPAVKKIKLANVDTPGSHVIVDKMEKWLDSRPELKAMIDIGEW